MHRIHDILSDLLLYIWFIYLGISRRGIKVFVGVRFIDIYKF